MKFIKQLNKVTEPTSLKYFLHKALPYYRPGRTSEIMHASEMTKEKEHEFCPRQLALMEKFKVKPHGQFVSTSSNVTWTLGYAVQNIVVEAFADMGRTVGNWVCSSCKHVHLFCKRPKGCSKCHHANLFAEEIRFRSDYSGASCGVDNLVNLNQPKLVVMEIKTIKDEEWKDLKAPLAEHKWRTNLYLRIIAEDPSLNARKINTDFARILYVTKNGYGKKDEEVIKWNKEFGLKDDQFSPFKEFIIKRDDSETDGIVERARQLKLWKDDPVGTCLPDRICNNAFCKRAKNCPVMMRCFEETVNGGKEE